MRGALVIAVAVAVVGCGSFLGVSGEDEEPPPGGGGGTDASVGDGGEPAADANGSSDGAAAGDAQAQLDAKGPSLRVFVSSLNRTGASLAFDFDTFCQTLADGAQLGGKWVPWLSYTGRNVVDAIKGDGPWMTLAGGTVAANRAELFSGKLAGPIDRDQNGASRTANAWTGTAIDGTALGNTCNGWKANVGYVGTYGQAGSTDAFWTNWVTSPCTEMRAVYCFEITE